jgi:hypothetical protein
MFKKIYLFASLLAVTAVQADVRIAAHLDVSHNGQVTHVDFDNLIIPENHYAGITTFYSESGYRLGVRIVGISDTVVTVELFVEDANSELLYNPTLACTWDVQASTQIGIRHYEKKVDELIALTITVSRS